MEEIFVKLSLSILSILLYTLLKALPYIQNNSFDIKYFLNHNYKKWIWSLITIIIVVIIISLEPATGELIKVFLGLDILDTPASFFTLGLGISNLVQDVSKSNKKQLEKHDG